MRKVLILTASLALFCILVFLIPGSIDLFSYSFVKFMTGEVWRLLTFSFAHINTQHLVENIVALSIVSLLAFELKLDWKEFTVCFLASSLLIALASSLIFPLIVIAGASMGIYAVLGGLSIRGTTVLKGYILLPLFGFTIFIEYILNSISGAGLSSVIFHSLGFVTGAGVFYSVFSLNRKKNILQNN